LFVSSFEHALVSTPEKVLRLPAHGRELISAFSDSRGLDDNIRGRISDSLLSQLRMGQPFQITVPGGKTEVVRMIFKEGR
jgi:hypothetical protein